MSRRGFVCGSNVPLITELGRDVKQKFVDSPGQDVQTGVGVWI